LDIDKDDLLHGNYKTEKDRPEEADTREEFGRGFKEKRIGSHRKKIWGSKFQRNIQMR
jgi:hypothetical protein